MALQHRVWRDRALNLWRRAGLRRGASVLDIGCGPGWAALDLAEIVGPQGRVIGIDRAPAYIAYAQRLAETRELRWLDVREAELSVGLPIDTPMDFAWCRWVLILGVARDVRPQRGGETGRTGQAHCGRGRGPSRGVRRR